MNPILHVWERRAFLTARLRAAKSVPLWGNVYFVDISLAPPPRFVKSF